MAEFRVVDTFERRSWKTLEPVIRMSPERISVEILKFEFNFGSNWKKQCYLN